MRTAITTITTDTNTATNSELETDANTRWNSRRASRTFAGLAAVTALTLGAAACSSDETDPGGDDPIEVPDDTIAADPALDE